MSTQNGTFYQLKCFCTADVLLCIVSCLNVIEIARCQRVCKTWKNALQHFVSYGLVTLYEQTLRMEDNYGRQLIGKSVPNSGSRLSTYASVNMLNKLKKCGDDARIRVVRAFFSRHVTLSFQLSFSAWAQLCAQEPDGWLCEDARRMLSKLKSLDDQEVSWNVVMQKRPKSALAYAIPIITYRKNRIYDIAPSPCGRFFALAGCAPLVVWKHTGIIVCNLDKCLKTVHRIAWCPSGKYIAGCGMSKNRMNFCVWNANDGARNTRFDQIQYDYRVISVGFQADGVLFAIGSALHGVMIWKCDVQSMEIFLAKIEHKEHNNLQCATMSPCGKRLALCDCGGFVHIWNLAEHGWVHKHSINNDRYVISSASWSPAGDFLAFGGKNKCVNVWEFSTQQIRGKFGSFNNNVNCVAWSPGGKKIAITGQNNVTWIYDVGQGNAITVLDEVIDDTFNRTTSSFALWDGDRMVIKFYNEKKQVVTYDTNTERPINPTIKIDMMQWLCDFR